MQLAIDTSTSYASLAVVQGYQVLAEMTWLCGSNHSVELSPRLDALLSQNKIGIETLDCVIVAKGPGSFNGLRVGVSAAKGIAFSLGIPIIGISTLEASAYQFACTGLPVCAIQNAGREEIAAAIYQLRPRKGWICRMEEQILTPDLLGSRITGPTVFCGEMDIPTKTVLKKLFKSHFLLPGPAGLQRRAAYLAELGQGRIAAGQYDNLATLQPLYLQHPPITERKKPF
ncbi:MAG TPA: tRNA (adenosine(37)-N6)-threonylcarbamoyltransferase complex dimerization subunit type 1 TsaB [Dehalococcoidales bacterium]|nr:tRNA (adenosine(37)-N6)-threonylcarbamoyltransferase complex dimerization subunit type 1 TsaB [Dehalococcoidales bacterium]